MILSSLIYLAFLANAVTCANNGKADFSKAASDLVSQYIPSSAWSVFTSSVAEAAAAASITGAPDALAYSLLLQATDQPDWFSKAIPTQYSSQFQALDSAIAAMRPGDDGAPTGAHVTVVPTVVVVTGTGSDGKPYTTSVSSTITKTGTGEEETNGAGDGEDGESNPAAVPSAFAGNAAAGVFALVGLAVAL